MTSDFIYYRIRFSIDTRETHLLLRRYCDLGLFVYVPTGRYVKIGEVSRKKTAV